MTHGERSVRPSDESCLNAPGVGRGGGGRGGSQRKCRARVMRKRIRRKRTEVMEENEREEIENDQVTQAPIKIAKDPVREFRITKATLDRYGTTPGCIGCEAHLAGFCRRHHDDCRRSIEQAMAHDDELKHRWDARDARRGKTLERDEKFEEADEHMPEVIGEGEDEGAEESEKEELTGSDHGACSSPATTFPAGARPPDDDRNKRVRRSGKL